MQQEMGRMFDENVHVRYTLTEGGHRICDVLSVNLIKVGAPVTVAHVQWEPPSWLPGLVKHGSRASWILAARQLEVDEILLVDHQGYILEANRSNVFAVIDGVMRTPPLDGRFLEGITRRALIEAAQRENIPLLEQPIHRDAVFEEFYLSSTLKELAPVVAVDGHEAVGGGPVGRRLLQAFQRLVAQETGQA
jgi:branched-subunit amino acid aminotransferase/4-amino-4-deoxychorismate lyase